MSAQGANIMESDLVERLRVIAAFRYENADLAIEHQAANTLVALAKARDEADRALQRIECATADDDIQTLSDIASLGIQKMREVLQPLMSGGCCDE